VSQDNASLSGELKTLHLTEPFRIAHGTSTERVMLRVRRGDGIGEAPFVPYYGDDPQEALHWVQQRGDAGLSQAPRAARLALDLLHHDEVGKKLGLSLRQLLPETRGRSRTPPGCRSLGIPQDLKLFREKVSLTAAKFSVLKLKMGSGNLDHDEAIAAIAREAAPHATFFADANGGWTPEEAARIIPKLGVHGLKFVEQPVSHERGILGWQELRDRLPSSPLPLFADESALTVEDVPKLAGLVDGVNVKLLKCGGIRQAIAMVESARAHRMQVMLGCMIESSIGVTAAAQLASLADWIDLDGHLYLSDDDHEGLAYDGAGHLLLPDRPGLGVISRHV
jgi:L-alanine-DL-glutamate epimerase-like enolase superfamily enzyme